MGTHPIKKRSTAVREESALELLEESSGRKAEVFIVHGYSDAKISNPRHGATRLIAEQIAFLKERDFRVHSVELSRLPGLGRAYHRIQGRLLKKMYDSGEMTEGSLGKAPRVRGTMNLIRWLLNDLAGRIDYFICRADGSVFSQPHTPAVVIHNYPFGIKAVSRFLRKRNPQTKLILYEHNLEWKFHQDKMGNGILSRILVGLAKKVEMDCIKEADFVFCLSANDRDGLIREGIDPEKIKVWLPICESKARGGKKPGKFGGRFVIGYVGTNFRPNILAVQNIIRIAKELPDDYVFIIIGDVEAAFKDREGLPKNVLFTGYVEELDRHLASCDAFLNPKRGSDTGAEIKMLDYIRHRKPIIASEEGARGFEGIRELTVCDVDEMAEAIRNLRH